MCMRKIYFDFREAGGNLSSACILRISDKSNFPLSISHARSDDDKTWRRYQIFLDERIIDHQEILSLSINIIECRDDISISEQFNKNKLLQLVILLK